jgi:DNA invertase Pin-like site-specific DNA recombinase
VLLVENFDRVSRQAMRKAFRTIEDIVESGVSLVTLTDEKEYDADSLDDSSNFMIAMILLMRGNEESERKSQRLKKAWEGKKLQVKAKIMTAAAPSWLTPNADRTGWIVDKAKAKVVKRIFDLTLKGWGVNKIGQTLNLEGVAPIGRADRWHVSFIQKTLQNPAVIGDLHDHRRDYDKKEKRYVRRPTGKVFKGYYPRIIDPAVFRNGRIEYRSTGGTSISCVFDHIRENRFRRSLIVTDGYIEYIRPEMLRGIDLGGLRVLLSSMGQGAAFEGKGITYHQLKFIAT